jgi:hypothetical protein
MNTLSWETDALDYWRLCDELSVVQAALLIVGKDPLKFQHRIDTTPPENRPAGYDAAKAALMNAINRKRLPAGIAERDDTDSREVDWHRTVVAVEDTEQWLRSRGIGTGFFFPAPEAGPDYLSAFHPNYSAKLAAAIEAWKAVSADDQLRRGKTVKQALHIWLRMPMNSGSRRKTAILTNRGSRKWPKSPTGTRKVVLRKHPSNEPAPPFMSL